MLKYQIDSLDGLDDATRALYVEKDGKFVLAIEGAPQPEDVSGLKKKVQELLDEKKAEGERRRQADEEARKAAEELARKGGDVEALDRSWTEKHTKAIGEKDSELGTLRKQVRDLTVGRAAIELAAGLAVTGSERILSRFVEERLDMETRDGRPTVVVRDKDGRPSALSLDDLKNEFSNDPAFAPLIAGTRASGGGAGGAKGGGAAKTKLSDYSEAERTALLRDDPTTFNRLVEEAKQR
jgi:hypothetical protein